MPNATIDPGQFERKDLKSLEGAYVMVRPLPYGMTLERRDKATKMYMESETRQGRRRRDVEQEVAKFSIETLNKWSTLFDLRYCIGEHNLTDVNENPLDLSSEMTLQILDPKIGTEIEDILREINEGESAESLEDFTRRHTTPIQEEETGSPPALSEVQT